MIAGFARAEEHLPLIIWTILHLHLCCHRLHLLFRVRNADKVAVRNQRHAVAGGAHLLVHLVPAADGGVVVGSQEPVVRPGVAGGLQPMLCLICVRNARKANYGCCAAAQKCKGP